MAIFFWKYQGNTRNFPGYHLSADASSMNELVSRLGDALNEGKNRRVRFALSEPTPEILEAPNNRRHRALTQAHLVVEVLQGSDSALLQIEDIENSTHVKLSVEMLAELVTGINGLTAGKNDYCIGGKGKHARNQCIWFW